MVPSGPDRRRRVFSDDAGDGGGLSSEEQAASATRLRNTNFPDSAWSWSYGPMDLRDVQVLRVAIANGGSMTAAAGRFASLSRRSPSRCQLEEHLGTQLFIREHNGA